MNKNLYTDIIREGVQKVTVAGKSHYVRLPGALDGNIVEITCNKDREPETNLVHFLCHILCDKKGNKIFDVDDPNDFRIIRELPDEVQTPLILKAQSMIFSLKKKQSKIRRLSSFLLWPLKWVKRLGRF